MGWPTAQAVLTQAALELGLIQSSGDLGDDAFDATDPNVLQLCALLKKTGRELVDEADWTHLRSEFAFKTPTAGAALAAEQSAWSTQPLPADWRNMVDQSGWNRTNRLPLGGPLSEQEWQYLASRLTGVVLNVLFRPMQGLLYLYPPNNTPAGQEIVMAYKSGWWVQNFEWLSNPNLMWLPSTRYDAGDVVGFAPLVRGRPISGQFFRCVAPGVSGTVGPDPAYATMPYVPKTSGVLVDGECNWNFIGVLTSTNNVNGLSSNTVSSNTLTFGSTDTPTSGADQLMFDEVLLVAKLKLLWLRAKGFDSLDAERDYNNTLARVVSNDCASPKLSLNGPKLAFDPLLGLQNFPITGFGS